MTLHGDEKSQLQGGFKVPVVRRHGVKLRHGFDRHIKLQITLRGKQALFKGHGWQTNERTSPAASVIFLYVAGASSVISKISHS
jgi:hypothetical protein